MSRVIGRRAVGPILTSLLASWACAQVSHAQTWRSQQQIDQLIQNVRRLQVTLRLDREEYFAGEDVELTITIKNPGPVALEVPEFFYFETGTVEVYYHGAGPKNDPRNWDTHNVPEGGRTEDSYAYVPTRWLQPSQTEEWRHHLSDDAARHVIEPNGTRQVEGICSRCALPEYAGEFRYCYDYGDRTCADFRVVVPVLELSKEARLEKPGQYQPKNPNRTPELPIQTYARFARTAVLGYQGTHIVVATIPARGDMPPKPDPTRPLTIDNIRSLEWYQRLATSSTPITSLDAKADAAENLTIQYTDQTGGHFTIKLGPDRRPLK